METQKEKILMLATTFPRWTNDKLPMFIFDLAKHLTAKYEVHILAPHFRGSKVDEVMEGVIVHRFVYAPGRFEVLAYGGGGLNNIKKNPITYLIVPFFFIANFISLIQIIRKYKIRTVNAHWFLPSAFVAAIAKRFVKFTLISTSHGGDVYGFKQAKFFSKLARLIIKFVINSSDRITVVSSAIGLEILKYSSKKKLKEIIDVIPMGIDLSQFKNNTLKKIDQNKIEIGFLGRLAEKKGTIYLLKAIKILKERNLNISCNIAGDGPDRVYLEKYVRDNNLVDVVNFIGFIDNTSIQNFLSKQDMLVIPSIVAAKGDREGLPVTVMEAMAAKTPVIVSMTDGITDLINDGFNGLLTIQKNEKDIVEKILRLINEQDLRSSIVNNAFETIKTYDWKNITDKFSNSYKYSKRKDVIMITTFPPQGGISDYSMSLVKSLDETGAIHLDILGYESLYPSFIKKPVFNDTPIPEFSHRVRYFPKLVWWNTLGAFIRILFNRKKILHIQYWSPATVHILLSAIFAAKLTRKKVITTIHNPVHHEAKWISKKYLNFLNAPANFFVNLSTNMMVRSSDKCILHNNNSYDSFVARYPNQSYKAEIIGHPVINIYSDNKEITPSIAKQQLEIPENKVILLCFGNIRKYKGVEEIIDIFGKLDSNKFHLIIAGRVWSEMTSIIAEKLSKLNPSSYTLMNDYIKFKDIELLFKSSDILLLNHQNFSSASGILNLGYFYNSSIIANYTFKDESNIDLLVKSFQELDENKLMNLINNKTSSKDKKEFINLKNRSIANNYLDLIETL